MMTHNKQIRTLAGILTLTALVLGGASPVKADTVLFSDSFDRPNNLNIDASATGMSGTAAPMTYWESDLLPTPNNDALSQILNNSLYLAYGPNASVVALQSHNFIDSQILADGGFRISMDMQKLSSTQTGVDNYCGFGVGVSTNELAALDLDFNSTNGPRGRFSNASFTGKADFYTCWTVNGGGDLQVFLQGAAVDTQYDVNVGTADGVTHKLRADFYPAGFNAGDNVNVFVYIDNNLVVSTSFAWHDTHANYIALSARIDSGFVVDNLLVQTITPSNAPPAALSWLGDGSANQWNTSSLNWKDTLTSLTTNFSDGKSVTFDDSSANTNVSVVGTVSPGSTTVNNGTNNYTFSGSGTIAGTNVLFKYGTGILTLNQGNSFSGGSTVSQGRLRVGNNNALGTGSLTLSGGTVSSSGSTAHTLANPVTVTTASGFGDMTDNGTLTFSGILDLNGAARNLTVNSNSTVVFAGGATNGVIGRKSGGGTLIVKGLATFSTSNADVGEGTLIYDGATVTNTARVIANAGANAAARLVITNGSIVANTANNGNLRSGLDGAATGSNYVDLAGLYSLPNSPSPNGNATLRSDVAYAEMTFLPGGDFTATAVQTYNNGGTVVNNTLFKFNGGILRARNDNPTFFEGIATTLVQSGGANIDDGGFAVTINQALLNDPSSSGGGLTKFGAGTLTLNGANTYTGSTVVSNGTLVINSGTGATGSYVVADGAKLSVTNAGSTLTVPSLTAGTSGISTLQFHFPGGNPGSPTIAAASVTGNGTVKVNVYGAGLTNGTFPLVAQTSGSISGLANFQLGTLQPGVSAVLVKTSTTISVQITSVVKSLEWAAAVDNNWNTSTLNWNDLNTFSQTNYAQSGGFGDTVTFDGPGSGTVNLTLAVTPVAMIVNGGSYNFTGAGRLSGGGNLKVDNFAFLTLGTVNDYSGGTTVNGYVFAGADQALGGGPVTLVSGQFASDGTTAHSLTNLFIQTVDSGFNFGDVVKTGRLTLGGLDLNGGTARTLDIRSDVVFSGGVTNGAFTVKTGTGALVIKGGSQQTALVNQSQGNVVIDGIRFDNGNGWRLANTDAGNPMHLVVTNGGLFTITIPSANLRIGQAGISGDGSANNIVDVAGTIDLTPAGTVGGNSSVGMGFVGANCILNVFPGGNILTRAVFGGSPANTEAHFYGGKLTAIANETGFIQGLTNAYLENGGLTIDTTNYSVTVPQALLAAGSGGLTKTGTGTLTLTGANTYSGTTTVNGGRLVLGAAHAATGGITVNANSTLAFLQTAALESVHVPAVTIGGGANAALEAQLFATNAPAGVITNLVLNGTVAVNVSGPVPGGQMPLFGYGTISGTGGLTVGVLPQGDIGHLVTNVPNKTIDLVVDSIALTTWTGATNGDWDTVKTNWTSSGVPVAYQQLANVLFDDSASNLNVNLTTTLTPSSITVSNNTLAYTFAGSGSLAGSMTLTKNGAGSLTISTPNTYTGNTTVKAGTLVAGNGTAFGSSATAVTVQSGGTLDVKDTNLGSKPVLVGGNGAGGTGALINSGVVGQNNALLDVTLTTNTTIRADSQFGIRTPNETDPGFHGNGYSLIKTGIGTLALNGGQNNTNGTTVWDSDLGNVDVQQGTLSFQRRMTMGRGTNTITVETGATLEIFALNPYVMPVQTNAVQLNNGTFGGNGNNAAEGSTFGGPITLSSGTNFIRALAGTTLQLVGPIKGGGDFYNNSGGAATVSLAATNTYAGKTVVQSGTLLLKSSGSISNTSGVYINSGARFDVSAFSPWTVLAAQTLGGSGTNIGSLQVNGTLAPGDAVGTLTVNGNLTLAGKVLIEVDKSLAQSNDMAAVSGALSSSSSGTITVTNIGAVPLAVGDKFTLFNQVVAFGNTMTVTGGNATWENDLAVDGSIKVLTVSTGVNTNAFTLTNTFSGGNLNLSWPADHTGYRLQAQTNTLAAGLKTNWATFGSGYTTTNMATIPVSPTNPAVFFRLVYP